ncbi:LegC family aminotransferase [Geobacter sulfurreducens]|jgi:perosamine synthetase|uniref:GDP-perosamine synthase n=1 Tax=Geobacter sulfurreducens (strain ATCC 51573 / DSM 12127 / PCA) TaxID=243231 RepID=Q74BR7_GEOSL|nr:LegC family aminotransferase [Geobacter sulfurreducens]AAR35350.1 aminotransferase, AHBA_syn family [Geobacter sulfurreducens PCA]ADI84809.1 aminotransferase, AHBA_syn family [Geobacter sulfurreducens KN400]UAC02710.1 LegC family aminotransferase [Geobacter sulfurreducens]HBB70674.1 LegC family aminotransferase [Geobacter sulfurreducens]HCD96201.1 LegC family aminotransferase [Geobacter sulfurreducens]
MIPLSVPTLKGNEWKYVKECLDTGWVSSAGKFVDRFESDFCAFTGSRHAVACVNGTAALQVALRIVGVCAGDEVIVPTLTFIATVNAVTYLGAEPVFMDCDEFYNIDVRKTAEFLEQETEFRDGSTWSRVTGRRIAAIVPVHVFGNAARMSELVALCRERNIKVVEDSTESLGTVYCSGELDGKHTGTVGDMGCFSFNGNKIITTGGGGMIVTDVPEYAERARYLTTQAKDDEVRYVHNEVGYNFRLTNVQAAIGVAQLELLPEFLEAKRANYLAYQERIDRIDGLILAEGPAYARNNHWMYALQIDPAVYGKDREQLMEYLKGEGVQTRPVWYLNHLQVPFRDCRNYRIEKAFQLLEATLSIPCSANLSESDIDFVAERLRRG